MELEASKYQPAERVLDRLKEVDFVAVVGPTAVGKTSMIKLAVSRCPELHMVINNTSRSKRPEEEEGVDYNFKTREEMEARIQKGEYVQVAPSVFGDWYATAPEGYATEGVAVLAVLAEAMPVFRALPFKSFRTVFVLPPSWEVWHERLGQHHFTPQQLPRRLHEAKVSLEFALHAEDAYFVINDQLDQAAADFAALALGQPLPERLQTDQERAEELVATLLKQLAPITPAAIV